MSEYVEAANKLNELAKEFDDEDVVSVLRLGSERIANMRGQLIKLASASNDVSPEDAA